MRKILLIIPALVVVLVSTPVFAAKPEAPHLKVTYQYSRHGDPDVSVIPVPIVVLAGGGVDVEEGFRRMCAANNGGDFLVLGTATFNKSYYSYIRNICTDAGHPANSVSVLTVPDSVAADDPFVYQTILQAESIWIAGGDQGEYIDFWSNRGVQRALNARIAQGVAIGGISAGLNILTEFVFTAQGSISITSTFALANPNSPEITLARDFVSLGALEGLIGDPHFAERDRMGRDLTFLYRIANQWLGANPRAISVDEGTAVVITGIGKRWTAEVVGAGNAYFLQPTALPSVLGQSSPLTGVTVQVFRVAPGGTFPLSDVVWRGSYYNVYAENGVLRSTQLGGAIY